MPHISPKKLDDAVLDKLFEQFFKTLQKASDKRALKYIGSELFTYTEKIMLAKRLAAILLLSKDVPQLVIAKELHLSTTTVNKIALKIENDKYKSIRKISGVYKRDLVDTIEHLLLMGMPPRVGKGRWSDWGR